MRRHRIGRFPPDRRGSGANSPVRKAVRSFPADTGGCPSDLRPQHLKDAMFPDFEDGFVFQLAGLLNPLAQGTARQVVQPYIAGAGLMAWPKSDGVHPSVVAGEVYPQGRQQCSFRNTQRRGTDIVRAATGGRRHRAGLRGICACGPQPNSSARSRTAPRPCPVRPGQCFEVRPPARHFGCGTRAGASVGDSRLISARGVQKGCSLGPQLFSLSLHRAVARGEAQASTDWPAVFECVAFSFGRRLRCRDRGAMACGGCCPNRGRSARQRFIDQRREENSHL